MSIPPTPSAADPLFLFGPRSPLNPAFVRYLLINLMPTQIGYASGTDQQKADICLAVMHLLASYCPETPAEAMAAAQILALNARVFRCLDLAAAPDTEEADARRHGAQAASLTRCVQTAERNLLRAQAARRADAAQPSERTGHTFRDASVPAPEAQAAAAAQHKPMQSGAPTAATRPNQANGTQDPMPSEKARLLAGVANLAMPVGIPRPVAGQGAAAARR